MKNWQLHILRITGCSLIFIAGCNAGRLYEATHCPAKEVRGYTRTNNFSHLTASIDGTVVTVSNVETHQVFMTNFFHE